MKYKVITLIVLGALFNPVQPTAAQQAQTIDSQTFTAEHPRTSYFRTKEGRITRVYGQAFSHGNTAIESANNFVQQWSGIWGCKESDFIPVGPWGDGQHLQPIMYNKQTDSYKFTGVGYTQTVSGVPVYGSRLSVLVRNENNFPAVHVTADLHNLHNWTLPKTKPSKQKAVLAITKHLGNRVTLSEPALFVYAGTSTPLRIPHLAYVVEASTGSKSDGTYAKWLYIVDAIDGSVLHIEDRILHDIAGNVSGMATQSSGADECDEELVEPLPYAQVSGGGESTYTDVDGNFLLPTSGSNDINVTTSIAGQWFNVENEGSSDSSLSDTTPPDGSVDFIHNAANNQEYYRAEVNAYIESNVVRDFALVQNPDYPTISTQENWPVNVNINSSCNAFYDYESINFYRNGGGCNNMAFSVIVHHEYGHHLVAVGGSDQGEYGEGMADVMGVLITGDNHCARGFNQGDCEFGIRNADNDCQYKSSGCSSCGSQIHACGQLISGCVWDIRDQLLVYPDGNEIISSIAVNSILLHNGSSIDEAIPIDFLTLDDSDDDIGNGTPHYFEIANGFIAHGIEVPQLDFLNFAFPDGLPYDVLPNLTTTIQLEIAAGIEEPLPDQVTCILEVNGTQDTFDVTYLGGDQYTVTLPSFDCDDAVNFYFRAQGDGGTIVHDPLGAPGLRYDIVVGTINETILVEEGFNDGIPSGWSATGLWSATTGCLPSGECDDGGSAAYFGFTDSCTFDNGDTVVGSLTTPAISLDGIVGDLLLSFCSAVETENLSSYDHTDLYINGSLYASLDESTNWEQIEIALTGITGNSIQLEWRFDSVDSLYNDYRGWHVDGVRLIAQSLDCNDDVECPADANSDGLVNVSDLLTVIDQWGTTDPAADINGDGIVDVSDLLAIVGNWGPCV